ncbi:hypothetical protein CEV32_2464 [Brucella rhizosphaerae]|uniref:Uncharacterized protein n=1 Tax=Brucella rhizosphaerae TaxID=571254 RepID=A0A256F597_9HYPH|nr:hypothetical protein CEV32_2464 [Brucella rhizosphaerae]
MDTNIQISPSIQHVLSRKKFRIIETCSLRRHMQRPAALHFKIQIAAGQFLATVY